MCVFNIIIFFLYFARDHVTPLPAKNKPTPKIATVICRDDVRIIRIVKYTRLFFFLLERDDKSLKPDRKKGIVNSGDIREGRQDRVCMYNTSVEMQG